MANSDGSPAEEKPTAKTDAPPEDGAGARDSEVDVSGPGDAHDGRSEAEGGTFAEAADSKVEGPAASADRGPVANADEYSKAGRETHDKKSPYNGLVIGLIIAVGVAAFFAGAYTAEPADQDQLTQEDLDRAVAKLELMMMQQPPPPAQPAQPAQQEPPRVVNISADDDPTIGNQDAPIAIIEFSDFQCPFCERFSTQTLPAIQEEYIDKGLVKLVYRDFPLQSIHPNAVITALAAECADDQGSFKGMHDILFEKRVEWNSVAQQEMADVLIEYAHDIGIDVVEFEECLVSGEHVDEIRMDIEDGRSYGVTGTPGFFVGNDQVGYVSISGAQPFESFKRVIDAQLAMG